MNIQLFEKTKIFIFDRDVARRAALSHMLTSQKYHVEPSHDIGDYRLALPDWGIMLVHDDGFAVREVMAHQNTQRTCLPVLAYDLDPALAKVVRAMLDGASDYLAWPFSLQMFSAHADSLKQRFAQQSERRERERRARERFAALSNREQEVLHAMGEGVTTAQIAHRLAISQRTVEIHRLNAIRKLGARRTADAIRIMVESKLAEGDGLQEAPVSDA